jgi:probable HAF family extracellular repeat protein
MTEFPSGFSGAAINASGQAAGTLVTTNIIGSAAFYSNGTVTDIAAANTDPTVASNAAFGISDNGEVVGQSVSNGGELLYAFIYNGIARLFLIRDPCSSCWAASRCAFLRRTLGGRRQDGLRCAPVGTPASTDGGAWPVIF